jgi:putative GTP pyrophosphokinase
MPSKSSGQGGSAKSGGGLPHRESASKELDVKVRDYVAEPKKDGYRALHLINRHRGRLIEVQLRTKLQDAWANSVEADARRIAPGLKFGAGPAELRDFYVALGDFLAIADQGGSVDDAQLPRLLGLRDRVVTFRRAHDEP